LNFIECGGAAQSYWNNVIKLQVERFTALLATHPVTLVDGTPHLA
jgi:hypothetical protein